MHTPAARRILVAFAFLALVLAFIDLVIDRNGSVWVQWPVWGLSVPVAGAIGALELRNHRALGAWIGAGIMLSLGLIAIDLFASDGTPWFFWPVGIWMVVTAIVVGLTVDVLGMVPTSEPLDEGDRRRALDDV